MSKVLKCFSCESTNHINCGSLFPCPQVNFDKNIIGVCVKPTSVNHQEDGNLEGLFHNYDPIFNSDFMKTVTSLANSQKLGFLNTVEFEILGRQPIKKNRQRFNIVASKEDIILVPTSWVQEVRVISKYLHRTFLLGMEIEQNYLQFILPTIECYNNLAFDKGKISSFFSYNLISV